MSAGCAFVVVQRVALVLTLVQGDSPTPPNLNIKKAIDDNG